MFVKVKFTDESKEKIPINKISKGYIEYTHINELLDRLLKSKKINGVIKSIEIKNNKELENGK